MARMGRSSRRWHSVRRNGPGRYRIKIAEMLLRDLQITVCPDDISVNNSPTDRWYDCARWDVWGFRDGLPIHVCSWDRMGDIIKAGKMALVGDTIDYLEVCRG